MIASMSSIVTYPENPVRYFSKVMPALSIGSTLFFSPGMIGNNEINIVQEPFQENTNNVNTAVLIPNWEESLISLSVFNGSSSLTKTEPIEYNEVRNLRWTGGSMGAINLLDQNIWSIPDNTIKSRVVLGGEYEFPPVEFAETQDGWDDSLTNNVFKFGKQIKSKVTIRNEFPFPPIEWD